MNSKGNNPLSAMEALKRLLERPSTFYKCNLQMLNTLTITRD